MFFRLCRVWISILSTCQQVRDVEVVHLHIPHAALNTQVPTHSERAAAETSGWQIAYISVTSLRKERKGRRSARFIRPRHSIVSHVEGSIKQNSQFRNVQDVEEQFPAESAHLKSRLLRLSEPGSAKRTRWREQNSHPFRWLFSPQKRYFHFRRVALCTEQADSSGENKSLTLLKDCENGTFLSTSLTGG